MGKTDILDLKNRKIIYEYISNYPGVHLCELFRRLNITHGTIRYHLLYLEKKGLISKKKSKGYTRYFITKENGINNRELLINLRKTTPRNILLYLLVCTTVTQKDIVNALNLTESTIKYHLTRLEESKIIENVKVKNGKIKLNVNSRIINIKLRRCKSVYQLTDPYTVYNLLITNKDRFFDNGVTKDLLEFFELFVIRISNEHPECKNDDEKIMSDRVANFIENMIPIPFCC